MSNTLEFNIYGDDAIKLSKRLGLARIGDCTTVNTKIIITKVKAHGHSKVSLEFDL